MNRVIYSLYIDIDEKELDFYDKNIIKKGQIGRNFFAKEQFKNNYEQINWSKK